MKKKGELTTQQIVGLIILIISFTIILFFILRLNLGETTDKEICHNSVVMKSQSLIGSGSLDCKTNYVCISTGGECENFDEDYTNKIDLDNTKEEIMEVIAKEMADCWWMFGEGKINYAKEFKPLENKVCSICSIISFDKKIKEGDLKEISYLDFYNYLSSKEKNAGSYLYYLYKTNNVDSLGNEYLGKSFDFSKEYFVLTGLAKEGFFSEVLSEVFSFTKPGMILGFIDSFNLDKDEEKKKLENLPVLILEKTSENYEKIGCDEFLTKA